MTVGELIRFVQISDQSTAAREDCTSSCVQLEGWVGDQFMVAPHH